MNPKELVQELSEQYGLTEANISVKSNGEIQLDLEGLQILTSQLCTQLAEDELSPRPFHDDQKYFYCESTLTLGDGRRVKRTGTAMMGEALGDHDSVQTAQQAISIASGRAYRASLRAIGFDPIRAHKMKNSGLTLVIETEDQRKSNLRKQIHGIATDLKLIDGSDRSKYTATLAAMYDGRISTTDLDEDECQQFLAFLRAKQQARSRGIQLRVERELKAA